MKIKLPTSIIILLLATFNINAGKNKSEIGFIEKNPTCLSFTENKGQVHDQFGTTREDIIFGGTDGAMSYFLKKNGISYQTKKPILSSKKINEKGLDEIIYRLDVEWINCNKANISKNKPFNGTANFQIYNNQISVNSYKEVLYSNIYNGIDLKWYSQGKKACLKYDFIVKPGADFKQIKLLFKGAEKLFVNKKGELVIQTSNGEIREEAPLVFQNNKKLKAKWIVLNNTASFEITGINKSKEFIIDPAIRSWGTFYGNTGIDEAYFCTTDASGNVYVAGNTSSATSTLIATVGSHQTTYGGNDDAFLAKFNPSGVRLWATYYGGIGQDYGNACTVDGSNNVYLVGRTNSTSSISTAGAFQTANGGTYDAFIVKFNSSGVRQWATYYGGTANESGESCKTDAGGNVYLVGTTSTTLSTAITSPGAHQTVYGGGTSDAFIVKFNSLGARQWASYYGGNGTDEGLECATDGSGNIHICGSTGSSAGISTAGAHQATYAGGFGDGFLAKFNSLGVRQWATYYGTNSGTDPARACATDATGNVYIVGSTGGAGLSTVGAHQTTLGGGSDGYLVKFNSSGVRQWATYYGGTGNDVFNYCTTDAAGNLFACGNTFSGLLIATPGSYQSTFNSGSDGFLVKFNTSGVRDWGTYYGGTSTDEAWGCSTDGSGNVYLVGRTSSTGTVIATSGSHQTTNNGSTDGFLAKLIDCQLPASPTNITNPSNQLICSGQSATLSASSTGTINWFNVATGGISFATGGTISTSTLSTGNFTFYAEALTCANSATRTPITVTVNTTPTVSVNSGSICSGKSFTIIPSGASTYTIQGGNAIVSPLSSTSYTVKGTGSNGCISANTATANVTVHANPVISVNSGSICNGNTFTMVPSGGLSYTFSSGSNTIAPTINTNYTVTGSGPQGCTNTAVSAVTVNPLPNVTVNSGTLCSGNIFTITPSGAVSYTYSNGSNTVSPSINTTYTVTGASAFGCINSAVSNVSVYTTPSVNVAGGAVCTGGSFTLNPTGAFSYSYSSGSSIVTPTTTTTYTIYGISSEGCISPPALATIIYTSNLNVTITGTNQVCSGSNLNLTANGASTYSWSNGANANVITVNPTVNITYTVLGTSGSCSNTAIINVTVNPLPNIMVSGSPSIICSGSSATLSASGANTYSWNTNQTSASIIVTPTATTQYTVTGTNISGCENSSVITLSVSSCVGTETIHKNENTILIYPNPTYGKFYIKIDKSVKAELINLLGEIIEVFDLNASNVNEINIQQYAKGIYYLKIKDGDYTKKLILN